MNKTDREYFQQRVDGVVKCTNGNIATILNKKMKATGLTDNKKYKLISSDKATLKSENELIKVNVNRYSASAFDILMNCFNYPTTDSQKEKLAFNATIEARISEMMQEVTLEGKRLIDQAVLNLIERKTSLMLFMLWVKWQT